MMKRINALPIFFALVALSLSGPGAAAAVRDAGEFFSPQAEREADQLMQQIRQRHGKDVVVETVQSMPNAPAAAEARQAFYEAEVARRGQGTSGVYILASKQPTYFYAGVDPETQKGPFTPKDRAELRELLRQRFAAGDFDGGLLQGLRLIDERLASNASRTPGGAAAAAAPGAGRGATGAAESGGPPADARNPGAPPPGGTPVRREGGGMGIMGWLCLIAGALIIFSVVRMFIARARAGGAGGYAAPGMGRPGYDPRTGQPMGGYDPRYGPRGAGGMMGGGGGMGRGLLGGLLGGLAGGYLYDKMSGPGGNEAQANPLDPNTAAGPSDPSTGLGGGDYGAGGADFGGGDFGGGGGGDFGGGDFGGGE